MEKRRLTKDRRAVESLRRLLSSGSSVLTDVAFARVSTFILFFFSSRRRHARYWLDWSSNVCSSDPLLDLTPPYDSEIGSIGNSRMERLFLEHTFRWLVMEGVLVLVIPFERLHECAGVLSSHFSRLNIFRMTDEESVR